MIHSFWAEHCPKHHTTSAGMPSFPVPDDVLDKNVIHQTWPLSYIAPWFISASHMPILGAFGLGHKYNMGILTSLCLSSSI